MPSSLFAKVFTEKLLILAALIISVFATAYFLRLDYIIAYGDAESHLNIAKRVISSLTPGLAQLGGIWLPLPHLLLVPFTYFDIFWKSGLAGALVSGFFFIVICLFLYRFSYSLTKSRGAALITFLVFALNPNVLYMQSTPMTELPLMGFFILSSYYVYKFFADDKKILSLIFAALFGFLATLSRYDGWFLVGVEALAIGIYYTRRKLWKILEGKLLLFSTLAFFGIILWILWDWTILGDPLYFTNSPFSAKSQQAGWLLKNQLPAYRDFFLSLAYYLVTVVRNSGIAVFVTAVGGLITYLVFEKKLTKILVTAILLTPFIFYTVTLFLGQSVIFIPDLTPKSFEWRLFNVRYGLMALPTLALFVGYFSSRTFLIGKIGFLVVIMLQTASFALNIEPVLTLSDGISGLSSAKKPDAQIWLSKNYDSGLVLMDDYSRTLSIIRSNIPLRNVIYIGTKPYWEESLQEPEKYARWVILQKGDMLWKSLYENPEKQGMLYKYFLKAYTSPEILIFKRQS